VVHSEIEIPTVGRLVGFLDPEGNEVAAMAYESPMFGA
jgi:predicted enzyme related to lactoylglutathione lyase